MYSLTGVFVLVSVPRCVSVYYPSIINVAHQLTRAYLWLLQSRLRHHLFASKIIYVFYGIWRSTSLKWVFVLVTIPRCISVCYFSILSALLLVTRGYLIHRLTSTYS